MKRGVKEGYGDRVKQQAYPAMKGKYYVALEPKAMQAYDSDPSWLEIKSE
jgi:hypothetical protein